MELKDQAELSMDEILASIRDILRENTSPRQSNLQQNIPTVSPFLSPVNEEKNISLDADTQEQDVASICGHIKQMMEQQDADLSQPEPVIIQDKISYPQAQLQASAPQIDTIKTAVQSDYDDIVKQFAALFRQRQPSVDNTVRRVAEAAVVNEVVPVLAQWLEQHLPELVEKEVKRVMAKAGIR